MSRSLTIAIAQLHPHKGDYRANLNRLRDIFAQVRMLSPHPHVLHFPETVLSGYFVEGGVRDVAVTAGTLARDLDQVFADGPKDDRARRPLDVVVGFYEKWRDNLYNSAAYIRLGEGAARILHVHRKNFLPTYGLFDEERFVERGHTQRAFDTPWGGRAAMLVCEDAWHSITGTVAALDDAQLIFVLAAAPARGLQSREGVPGPGSLARWERLVRDIADEHGVFVSLANLAGSEGGKVFAGGSCLAGPRGDIRVRAPAFEEAILTLTIDLGDITRARSDMPLLSDLRTAMPHLRRTMDAVESQASFVAAFDAAEADGGPRGAPPESEYASTADHHHRGNGGYIIPAHHVPRDAHGGPPSLDIDPSMVEDWLVRFLRDEMGRRGFGKAVIGVSGGVDSAVTAYLAARAIGPENVLGVRLPYRTSSPDSLAHAQLVIDMLGIPSRTIDLSAAADGYLALEPTADGTRRGNVIARLRMIALFDLSAAVGGVPLGTGNKTERLFGYFTWHADDSPPLNPLGDLFKTQVWALAQHLGVPEVIVGKPATADLVAGQTDEADFGIAYARADTILNWLLWGFSTADLVARGFPEYEVELVRNRLERTHWKRKLPTVALLSHTAIGESYLRPVDY
jgi:NAD+ synthetase